MAETPVVVRVDPAPLVVLIGIDNSVAAADALTEPLALPRTVPVAVVRLIPMMPPVVVAAV